MTIKIIKTENDGFSESEVESLTNEFITIITKIKTEIESDICFELVELDNSDIMIIITKLKDSPQWVAQIFGKIHSLKLTVVSYD